MAKRRNRRFTETYKRDVVSRYEQSEDTAEYFSKNEGISITSLARWRQQYGQPTEDEAVDKADTHDANEKFRIVMETYSLNELEFGEYCRKNGLYKEQVLSWRDQSMSAFDRKPKADKNLSEELRLEKESKKSLEKELRQKEKALAEMGALLVLSKKARSIWGEYEEE